VSKAYYVAVTHRAPWQPACDKCHAELARPFYWTKTRSPYRTICEACYEKRRLTALLAVEQYGPAAYDPRYD